MSEALPGPADYPPAPWHMHGSLWLSAFRLAHDADARHPAGTYGVALVDYVEPSPLTYGELLVARTTRTEDGRRAVTITDIWVDSPASLAGGRALWAIPKQLCDFDLESSFRGPVTSTDWTATIDRRAIVDASFTDVSRAAPRVPSKGLVVQPPIDDHTEPVTVMMTGSARALPCRGRWSFAADGPLAFLREARQLASFRMASFRLDFS
ncbi:acetoacetate decarboxylase family protein [Nocardioides pelophilus]|uniref:acetoacetate decarboxylase family protein n=1 Tax=Nocardioides pelophilus TaxID=2172019 RepID=UPI001C7EA158|nr:acetoacetate decarboxylase family protein [Nocardioides pelophilus]